MSFPLDLLKTPSPYSESSYQELHFDVLIAYWYSEKFAIDFSVDGGSLVVVVVMIIIII